MISRQCLAGGFNSKRLSARALALLLIALLVVLLALVFDAHLEPSHAFGQSGNRVSIVSAASSANLVAPDSIAAIYGVGLATRTEIADRQPLPTELAGTTVTIGGRLAPLFFVSPLQINCLIPPNVELGQHPVIVRSGDGAVFNGVAQVRSAVPGIFTIDGRPAAQLLRVRNGIQLPLESVGTAPIDLGPESEQVYLPCG